MTREELVKGADPSRPKTFTQWGAPEPDQVIAHTNLYWTHQTAPGRTAVTVATSDVDFAPSGS